MTVQRIEGFVPQACVCILCASHCHNTIERIVRHCPLSIVQFHFPFLSYPVTLSRASVNPPLFRSQSRPSTHLSPLASVTYAASTTSYLRVSTVDQGRYHGVPKVTREQFRQGDGRRCWSASISTSNRRRVPTAATASTSSISDHLSQLSTFAAPIWRLCADRLFHPLHLDPCVRVQHPLRVHSGRAVQHTSSRHRTHQHSH